MLQRLLSAAGPLATSSGRLAVCSSSAAMRQLWQRHFSAGADAEEEQREPAEHVVQLAEEILKLNLLEVSDLNDVLRKRLGLPAPGFGGMVGMPMGGMPVPGAAPAGGAAAAAAEEPKEEKTEFDLKLEGFDAAAKIKVIKEVRAVTDLGLKEAKELVEGAPCVVKKGIKKEEAEELKKKLEAAGAKVALE